MAIVEIRYKDPYECNILKPEKFCVDDKKCCCQTADRDRTLFEMFITHHLLSLFEPAIISRSVFTRDYYIITLSCSADYFNLLNWLNDKAEVIK